MRIFTHVSPDLDAVCSVWAAKRFIPGAADAEVFFRSANWDGNEMTSEDIALDIVAGGKGLKGTQDENGNVHSCFAEVMSRYASPDDQQVMFSIIKFVDVLDAHGTVVGKLIPESSPTVKGVFAKTGLNAVYRAIQSSCGRDDSLVFSRMFEILDGMLRSMRARVRSVAEAKNIKLIGDETVAIIWSDKRHGTNGVLFSDYGVKIIVYVDGLNIGLIRNNDLNIRMDHPEIRAVVERAGELAEWFAHSNGFLFCRGSRKAPATTGSKVDPNDLAWAAYNVLYNLKK